MPQLRQASLMEERSEDDSNLAGPQHSQCWHTLSHTPGGAAGLMWAPGMFIIAVAMVHMVVKVVPSATEMTFWHFLPQPAAHFADDVYSPCGES